MDFHTAFGAAKGGSRIRHYDWLSDDFVVVMPKLDLAPHGSEGPGPKVNDRTVPWIGPEASVVVYPYMQLYERLYDEWGNPKYVITMGWLPSNDLLFSQRWEVLD